MLEFLGLLCISIVYFLKDFLTGPLIAAILTVIGFLVLLEKCWKCMAYFSWWIIILSS